MALGEYATIGGTLKFGTTDLAVIFGAGAPDGDSSPEVDAKKGSLYLRTDATDDYSPLYVKVDEDGSDDDWTRVFVDNEGGTGLNLNEGLTFSTDKKLLFRDTGLFIHSSGDGVMLISSDTETHLGDGTNQAVVKDDGEIQLEGTAKVTRTVPLPLIVGGGTATVAAFQGAPSLDLDADGEIWYFSFEAPNDWDEASDLTLVFMVGNEIAETDGDDVSITLQVRGYADGETMGDAGQTVAVAQDLTGGDEAINIINRCAGVIDYNEATYPIAAGDAVVGKAVINLTGVGECTGPLHIVAQWVEYTANKLGTAT